MYYDLAVLKYNLILDYIVSTKYFYIQIDNFIKCAAVGRIEAALYFE